MNQINAVFKVCVERLNIPCATLHARIGHSSRVCVRGVPGDVTGLFVRVFRTGGSYSDFPANARPNGEWICYMIGTAFPATGSYSYEIHATDADGNATAVGWGLVYVGDFSTTTTPVTPGATVGVAEIPCATGGVVQVQMVQDSAGQWVYQAVTSNAGGTT